jgi:hypothetical protein
MTVKNLILKDKCFFLYGFNVLKTKQLEGIIIKYGGKLSPSVDAEVTNFNTFL